MKECIFCKIVNGEMPSNQIYETDKVLAFLDIKPVSRGHSLVITKKHYKDVYDAPEQDLKEVMAASKKISEAMEKGLNADGVNILHASRKEAQQSVLHFHIHIVPRYKNDGLDMWIKSRYKESESDLKGVAEKIRKELN